MVFSSGINAYAGSLDTGIAFGLFRAYYHAYGSTENSNVYTSHDVASLPSMTSVTMSFNTPNQLAEYSTLWIEGDFQDGVTYDLYFNDLICSYGLDESDKGYLTLTSFYVQKQNGEYDLMPDVAGDASSGYNAAVHYTWDSANDVRIICLFDRYGSNSSGYDNYIKWTWSRFIMGVNVDSATGANVSGILNIITQIWGTIQNIPNTLQTIINNIGNIVTKITELPNLIVEKLEAAIIPDPDNMKALVDDFQKYFIGDENDPDYPPRLGFLGSIFDRIVTFFERMRDLNETPVSVINFPGIKLPASVVQNNEDLLQEDENGDLVFFLAPPAEVDLDDYAGPNGIDIIQYVRIATSFIIIISLINMAQNELNSFLNDHVNF